MMTNESKKPVIVIMGGEDISQEIEEIVEQGNSPRFIHLDSNNIRDNFVDGFVTNDTLQNFSKPSVIERAPVKKFYQTKAQQRNFLKKGGVKWQK